jgi:radical SAM superfamily enzyme with C-terminal helix-hairpin-helix motif
MNILELQKGYERPLSTLSNKVNMYSKYKLNIKNIEGSAMLTEVKPNGTVLKSIPLEIKEYRLKGKNYRFKANSDSTIMYEIFQ